LYNSKDIRAFLHSFPTRRSSDLKRFQILTNLQDVDLLLRLGVLVAAGQQAEGSGCSNQQRCDSRFHNPPPAFRPSVDGLSTQLRSEEHTSELQSRENLVCRLLLE